MPVPVPTVEPRRRLLLSLPVIPVAVLVSTVLLTLRDLYRSSEPADWHSAGGERQMVFAFLVFGTPLVMVSYLVFVLPLVLLWPAASQVKHWYAVLGSCLIWPPMLAEILERRSLAFFIAEWRQAPGFWLCVELGALAACAAYLVLLRHDVTQRPRSTPTL